MIKRFIVTILSVVCGLFCMSLVAATTTAVDSNPAQQQLTRLIKQYEQDYFARSPEFALIWGKSGIAQDKFMDPSMLALADWQKKEDDYLMSLSQIDETSIKGTPLHTTFLLLKETLENNRAARSCKEELWNVNPTFGWHNLFPIIAEKQPVGTEEDRKNALKRWQTFGIYVDNEITNLKIGLKKGYSAPKSAVERVLKQIKMMQSEQIESSPYFSLATRHDHPEFKNQVAELIKTVIHPALTRYTDFLENDYLPLARSDIGVSALPHGRACYLAKIKQQTTLSMPPEKIHQLGLQHMQQLEREVAVIGDKEFNMKDMSRVFQQAKHNPKYFFQSEQDILNYNAAALKRAKAQLPAWFEVIPKKVGIIKPYPPYRANTGASGEYYPPSEDGSTPGIFYINTSNPTTRSRSDQEATLFHELLPGHDFQVSLTYEDKSHSSLDKYLWNSGYGEGWALYVERLADDMQLYSDDISRLGMLSNESLRAARLVVDTGIHTMNWSREQAIYYIKQHCALSDNIIEGEVDRYIMMPGQATAYLLGKHEIESLRALSQEKLGNGFNIRQFHQQVLKNGAITLPMLRKQIEDWIAAKICMSGSGTLEQCNQPV